MSRMSRVLLVVGLALSPMEARSDDAPAVSRAPGVFCALETRSSITAISAHEGASVKAGAVVCVLDKRPLEDLLGARDTLVRAAEASLNAARLRREVAEMEVGDYADTQYKQDFEGASGRVALARALLRRSEDRVAWSDRMMSMGYASAGEHAADKLELQKAILELEQAQTALARLKDSTRPKTMKRLEAEVQGCRAEEQAKQAALDLARARRKQLLDQIEACRVKAPADGVVRLAAGVEAGALVREGQLLFRVETSARPR